MSEIISITPPPEAEAIIKRHRDQPGLYIALARTMDQQNLLSVGHAQIAYMSFPKDGPATTAGTRVQTNRLRSSVRASKSEITGPIITSAIGSNVVYALRQEIGFTGAVTVPAHSRKGINGTTSAVKSYTMNVHQEGRHMISKGITDRKAEYGRAFLKTVFDFEKGEN